MPEQLTIDQLATSLVEQMIHLTKVIPNCLQADPEPDLFAPDLHQFGAIYAQLSMLLCTKPIHGWAIIDWNRNFVTFLKQTLRQSHYCLKKYLVLTERTSPACSESLVHIWQDLSPLISQAKSWLSATGSQLSSPH
jgi:hypothetical protein